MSRADRKTVVAALCLLGLSACDKYVDRRDEVTFGSGDSVAFNKAAHIIDPWPASSRTVTHGARGEQAAAAIARLRRRESGEAAAPAAPPVSQLSPQSIK
jgi:hypothetical protein